MSQQVNKLIFILQEMVEVFEKLLLTATEKQAQLVGMDTDRLERTVQNEVALLDQVMLLEKKSGTIVNEINQVFFSANTLVLGKFVENFKNKGYDNAADLTGVYSKLREIGTKLKAVNEQNQNLSRFSQETIKETVKFICRDSMGNNRRYSHSGERDVAESILNLVDTQV